MPVAQLGDLTAAAARVGQLLGDRFGVVTMGMAHCPVGGDPHVAIGTDSVATMSRIVANLADLTPVQRLEYVRSPAWMGEASGVQVCVYVTSREVV